MIGPLRRQVRRALSGPPARELSGVILEVRARNIVLVRTSERGVVTAINTRLPARIGLPVRIRHEGGEWQVVGLDHYALPEPGPYPYVPYHADMHQWNRADGGEDPVWLDKVQYLPLLVAPTSPPSLLVRIFPGSYYDAAGRLVNRYIVQTLDMAPYFGEGVIYALISLDVYGGEIVVRTSPIEISVLAGEVPLGVVRLRPGATAIGWDDISDARDMPPTLSSAVSLQTTGIRRLSDGKVFYYQPTWEGLSSAIGESVPGDIISLPFPMDLRTRALSVPSGVVVDLQWSQIGSVSGTAMNYILVS